MSTFDRKNPFSRGNEHIAHPLRQALGLVGLRVVVLMPLRDDWTSAAELIRLLDQTICEYPCTVDVLLVDDGSIQNFHAADFQSGFAVVRSIRVLRLRRNLGHQRAIAIGLVHVRETMPCDAVLVMDGDGEDTADGALQLLSAFSGKTAVFAERSKRTESLAFRLFYRMYQLLHRLLTGISVRVGNFSILPSHYLDRLVVMSELWNHYAAAVFRSGLPFTTTPIPRGYRIAGKTKMNFLSLFAHGLSAISVFADVVGVRLLIASVACFLTAGLGIFVVGGTRIFTGLTIPSWAFYSIGALAIISILCVMVTAVFTFTILSNRTNSGFVPARDCELFVAEAQDIHRSPVTIQPSAMAASGGTA